MRLIHTADLHIDSKMQTNFDPAKAKIRKEELLKSFENMVGFASTNGVTVVMLSGDLFDKMHVKKTARERVMAAITDHPDIDFLYIRGNHDNVDFIEDSGELDIPSNFKLFNADEWTSYEYDDVVITGRELTDENARNLSGNLVLDRTKINIVMLHGQVTESLNGVSNPIVISDFRNKNIDYLALGHIHKYEMEKLDDRGIWCYPGCLEGRGFDECGEKGFVFLDTEGGRIRTEFIRSSLRVFHQKELTVKPDMSMSDIITEAEELLSEIPEKDIVKLVLKGEINTDFYVDLLRIEMTFKERYFFFKVKDETSVHVDYDSFINDRSLKGEFVRLVRDEDLPEDEKGKIIDTGIRAILGEEIEE